MKLTIIIVVIYSNKKKDNLLYMPPFLFRINRDNNNMLQWADNTTLGIAVPTAIVKLAVSSDDYLTTSNIMVCYSVRLVVASYTGPVIQVRSSTDTGGTSLTDFYTDAYQTYLTTGPNGTGTSYASWIGANTGYISKWYDQSGKGNHATNTANNISQPTLVQQTNNGVTKWVMYWQNANSSVLTTTTAIAPNTIFSHFYSNTTGASSIFTLFGYTTDNLSMRFINSSSNTYNYDNNDGNCWYASGTSKLSYLNNSDNTTNAKLNSQAWNVFSASVATNTTIINQPLSKVGQNPAVSNRTLNGYMIDLICHNAQMAASSMQNFYTNRIF